MTIAPVLPRGSQTNKSSISYVLANKDNKQFGKNKFRPGLAGAQALYCTPARLGERVALKTSEKGPCLRQFWLLFGHSVLLFVPSFTYGEGRVHKLLPSGGFANSLSSSQEGTGNPLPTSAVTHGGQPWMGCQGWETQK